ncbi:MAG: nitroreductase [Candidatus Aminicenantes bacterium]|nr:nitroreductase [Candidatus Aminicenantes bacterium]NIM85034.1 nitroreductase [Candidatus Aminicenantes bacterium]NIN24548.1 nitroreductase [Candidatus Aminicenantes bacterium]NIN48312.1 nitroreductase [Candidatus Aminicenantes bacterium]NIN91215.1 nitroreductase [Candidatus Aminicenantes bacterium]
MALNFRELLIKNRSYRRFYQEEKIDLSVLREMVENARITPSPANLQPLKFIIVNKPEVNRELFGYLKWAGYLRDWDGPEQGERPSAYIVILGDRNISTHVGWDYGIALQTLQLSAVEKGYGGCAIGSCDKEKIRELLGIPEALEIGCVLALGKPREKVVIDEVKDGDIKYWRDEQDVHHVPKRSLDELILKEIL